LSTLREEIKCAMHRIGHPCIASDISKILGVKTELLYRKLHLLEKHGEVKKEFKQHGVPYRGLCGVTVKRALFWSLLDDEK
jgi:predicted ArsR family transcriptional regulator